MVKIDVDTVQSPFYVDLFYQPHLFFNTNHIYAADMWGIFNSMVSKPGQWGHLYASP